MIGRALAVGLAALLFAAPVALADETSDEMGGVAIPSEEEEEEEEKEPANWARKGIYLEAGGEAIFEAFSSTTNRGKPISEVGGAVSGRLGWRAARPLSFEIQYERVFDLLCGTTASTPATPYCSDNNDANLMTVNVKYNFMASRRYQPFLRTGIGAIWGDLPGEWTRKSPVGTDSGQSGFVWRIGAGIDYGITEQWTASLWGGYVIPTQEFHRLNWGTVGVSIRYMF